MPICSKCKAQIHQGDCLDVLASFEPDSIDTVICDPPYALKFMGARWDYGLPGVDRWKAIMRVAKPGAMLLAFGGSRTFHRLTCEIEDAGWEIRDCIMWVYGQGFPKSLDISKAIDRAAGAERPIVGSRVLTGSAAMSTAEKGGTYAANTSSAGRSLEVPITAPATDAALTWNGWGTALKPAFEPIVVAMKPLDGTFAENAQKHGVAGLNIDGARIGSDTARGDRYGGKAPGGGHGAVPIAGEMREPWNVPAGRWPANVALTHAEGCERIGATRVRGVQKAAGTVGGYNSSSTGKYSRGVGREYGPDETVADWRCVDGCPVAALDEQSGNVRSSGGGGNQTGARGGGAIGFSGGEPIGHRSAQYSDNGGASRFFYCGKATKKDRGEGNDWPTVKPTELMRYLCRITKTPTGGVVLDPFMGSGTTLVAAALEGREAIGIDRDEHAIEIARRRLCRECHVAEHHGPRKVTA